VKVLVTGANGFVGRHLCEQLADAGYEVVPCTRRLAGDSGIEGARYLEEDENWNDLLDGIDAVVHTAGVAHQAAISADDPQRLFQKGNCDLTKSLAEAVAESDVKILIHVSSIAAAGYTRYSEGAGLSEEDETDPKGDYGWSKRNCEPAVEALRDSGKLGVNLRPPLIYGKGAKGNWPKLLKLAKSHLPLPFASVKNRRSFLGIENLGELVSRILSGGFRPELSGTYHVADDEVVSLRDVVASLRAAEGRGPGMVGFPIGLIERGLQMMSKETVSDGLFADLVLDIKKAKETFSWQPSVKTLEGMRMSVEKEGQI